jgi:hypothetical protein
LGKLESKRQADAIKRLKGLRDSKTFAVKLESPSHNGLPDVLCMRNGRTYYFEFKQPRKDNAALQAAVHRIIRATGHVAERVTCFKDCMEIINREEKNGSE